MKKNAFTLLEILVVISIIGILVALGTASYSTAQKKSRDARRKADIKALQNGFEQFYARESNYPTTWDEVYDADIFPAGIPEDPKDSDDYVYTLNFSAEAYCICALLENSPGNAGELPSENNLTTCTYNGGDYYCLSNLQ